MRSRFRPALLAAILTGLALAQVSSELVTPDIRRVGVRLACLCGSCKNSVADCPMLACHYAEPARQKIRDMQAAGKSDDEIVKAFIGERGIQALVVPPAEGFNLLAWVMPFVAIFLGLAAIWWFIQRMRKPSPVPEIDNQVLDRYRESIEKDLEKLD